MKESPETLLIDTLVLARALGCDGARYGSYSKNRKNSLQKKLVRLNFIALYNYQFFLYTENFEIYGTPCQCTAVCYYKRDYLTCKLWQSLGLY